MPKQTKFNDAQIRAESVQIEEVVHEMLNRAKILSEKFDALYPNLQFADPTKNVAFDRYMVTLARAKSLCECLPSLACQAREMQSYGKQQVSADVSNLSRITPVPAPVLSSCGGNAVTSPA